MSSDADRGLRQFAARFFENRGAILEKNHSGFEALLPSKLSESLGIPEHIFLTENPPSHSEDHYALSYSSPLVEKIVETACSQVPLLACQLTFDYLKSQGFDRLIKEQFSFPHAVGTTESTGIVKTVYLLLNCRYVAQSDEQKQGLLSVVVNYETGSLIPDMEDAVSITAKSFETSLQPIREDGKLQEIFKRIKDQSEGMLAAELRSFRESMNRRFRRDAVHLREYYSALKVEMEKSLERPGLSDELIKDRREKIALLPHELATKTDDLFKKYSIKVTIVPCAAMLINTPAVRVLYRVSVGRSQKTLPLLYNPVTRLMDPLVCQGCGKSVTSIYFCNHLHVLCSRCHERCPLT